MNQELVVRVTDIARGGAGVSREANGRVIFIPLSAPGDLVKIRITEENKRYAQGEILEILEASDQRQTPRCPAFGQCGGCQWQHLPYSLQWKTKSDGVLHALKRVEVPVPERFDPIPAEQIWEYRNRIQLRGESNQIGFFKSGSRQLVPLQRCDIARSEINAVWEETRKEGSRLPRPFKVEVEVMPHGEIRKSWNSRHAAGGFRQVHDGQNEKMKNWIEATLPKSGRLFDLFGGSGNFSISLSQYFSEIHCVDLSVPRVHPPDVPTHIQFHRAPVNRWLTQFAQNTSENTKEVPSVAIVDPPREGLGEYFAEIASALALLKVNTVIAIGCDPDAWARDMSRWKKRGWELKGLMVIDLFPQTPHVESLGFLSRTAE